MNGDGSKTRSNSNVLNMGSFSMKRFSYAGAENRLSINSINLKPNRHNGNKVHKKAKRILVLALKADHLSKKKNSRRFNVKNKNIEQHVVNVVNLAIHVQTPSTTKASQDTIESMNSTNLDDIKEETIKDIISERNKDNGVRISSTDTLDDKNDGNSREYQDVCDWLKRELLDDSTIKNETIDKKNVKI